MNLSNPGTKEYLVVGGVVLVLALGYFYLKNKSSSSSTAAPASSAPASSSSSSPTGLSTDTLKLWIRDHQSSPKKKTVTKKAA